MSYRHNFLVFIFILFYATSVPRFSSLSDETLNRGPVSIQSRYWWDVKPELTHSLFFFFNLDVFGLISFSSITMFEISGR